MTQLAAPVFEPGYAGQRTNPLAFFALIASLSAFVLFPVVGSLAGIVLGAIALGQVARRGEDGKLLAITAIVIGILGLLVLVATIAVIVPAVMQFANSIDPSQLIQP